jgi:hypothetical protein
LNSIFFSTEHSKLIVRHNKTNQKQQQEDLLAHRAIISHFIESVIMMFGRDAQISEAVQEVNQLQKSTPQVNF